MPASDIGATMEEQQAESIGELQKLRQAGTIGIVGGTAVALLMLIVGMLWRKQTGSPLPGEIFFFVILVALGSVGFGVVERVTRPTRTAVIHLQRRRAHDGKHLAAIDNHLERITYALNQYAAVPGRLGAVEEALRDLSPQFAEKLKEEKSNAYFFGYARATEDQLRPTGTAGVGETTGEIIQMHRHHRNSPN